MASSRALVTRAVGAAFPGLVYKYSSLEVAARKTAKNNMTGAQAYSKHPNGASSANAKHSITDHEKPVCLALLLRHLSRILVQSADDQLKRKRYSELDRDSMIFRLRRSPVLLAIDLEDACKPLPSTESLEKLEEYGKLLAISRLAERDAMLLAEHEKLHTELFKRAGAGVAGKYDGLLPLKDTDLPTFLNEYGEPGTQLDEAVTVMISRNAKLVKEIAWYRMMMV